MMRDFKLSRRDEDEIENVPVNPNHLHLSCSNLTNQSQSQSKHKPKHTTTTTSDDDQSNIPKVPVPPFDRLRTPIKTQTHSLLHTPDSQVYGSLGRNCFGFSNYNDDTKNVTFTPHPTTSSKTGYSDNTTTTNTTNTTPTKSVTKPPNPNPNHISSRHPNPIPNAFPTPRPAPASLSRRFSISAPPPSVVDTVHVPHFDLKEDPSFWMDHNVQAIIRVRPLNTLERNTHGFNRCIKQDNAHSITWIGQPETRFTFDHVACETVDQEMLFRMAGLPMVENCLSGYNSCMFAYGQVFR